MTATDDGDDLLAALKKAADPDRTWVTGSMAKLTVRFKDGTFKKAAIAAGDPPLILVGVRAGKRADFIFEFEPVDTRPYERIEMDDAQVFKMLPGFEEHVVTAMSQGFENSKIVAGTATSFKAACAKFRIDVKKRAARAAAEAQEAAASKAGQSYADNPLWGAFA